MSRRLYLAILIGLLMLVSSCGHSATDKTAPPSPTNTPQATTPLGPAVIIVNSTADDPTGCPATCTLRSALTTANNGDVIEFAPSVTGTITLTQTLPINKDLTINGPGADVLTLDGNQHVRVLEISTGTTASISGLTILNGLSKEGGGIYNEGTLTITASAFSGNVANDYDGGGIINTGTLTITASTFSGNVADNHGGGIVNTGTLIITASTFSGNSANEDGGGIVNRSNITVTDSTFSANSAGSYGGGIANWAGSLTVTGSTFSDNAATQDGGGISNNDTLTVTSSTFSGNSAARGSGIANWGKATLTVTGSTFSDNSGGGISNDATLTVTASTFSGNVVSRGGGIANWAGSLTVTGSTFSDNAAEFGGGVYNEGNLTITGSTLSGSWAHYGGGIYNEGESSLDLDSTIVAGNTADVEGSDIVGEVHSLGYNLIGDPEGATGFLASDLQNVDPLLGPLADNGGPTQTMALLEGSPAIDVGDPQNCPETDQRGALRVGVCDIGAYEFDGVVPEK